jgi:S-DNA-T family DNA segregation ATPase FtsK/SpoIIIE
VSLGLAKLAKIEGVARGRAFDRGGTEIQIAMVSGDSTRPELEQLQAAVRRIREHSQPFPVPPLRLLPDHVTLAGLGHSSSLAAVPLGIDERFRTVTVDLLGDPRFLVVGPPRSGRSTVLATLVGGIRSAAPGLSCYLLGTRRTPLSALGGWTLAATEIGAVTNVLAQLAELVRARAGAAPAEPLLVVIDDGDELVEAGVGPGGQIDQLQKTAADANVVLLAAVTTFKAQRTYSSWLGPMRTNRRGLLLAGDSGSADVFDSRLPHKAATEVPPGRGVLFRPSGAVHLQVATASE